MPDFTHEGPSRLAEGVDRALPDDAQAVTLEAHDGAPGVRQQDHVAHAEIQQDLGADAVVAQLAAGLGLAVEARPHRYRKGIGRGLRSDERRVGKESVSTCRSRCEPYHETKHTTTINNKRL